MSKRGLKAHLLIIDPQNDFMGNDDGSQYEVHLANGKTLKASLAVKGAVSDMKRAAGLVARIGHKLADIHVTLDSHHRIDVAHPAMWRDQNGRPPAPFTIISADDIRNGIWTPRNLELRDRLRKYAEALATQGNYPLMIWPPHCQIGTWGHNVQEVLVDALMDWEEKYFAEVDYVTKGTNVFTEHFGALQAEVIDPNDPTTQLNVDLLRMLQDADIIGVLGEASSHCVLETVRQVARNVGAEHVKKFHLITDCMSPVGQAPGGPDFPAIALQFQKEMAADGMTLTNSVEFLA